MFVITTSKDKTINWPVKVEIATDGGKIGKFEFTGVFRLLDDDEKEALAAESKISEPADDDSEPVGAWKERTVDDILKVMTGWKGVVDENKSAIEFNRAALLAAVRSPHGLSILRGITNAMSEVATGGRVKN